MISSRRGPRGLTRLALAVVLAVASGPSASGQSNTRLLLATGWGVPDHAGFVFGRFSGLTMNAAKDIVFLSTMRGARRDLRALVRSSGVSFDVVAFEGLRSPVPHATYESFTAPSLNSAGVMAFTATLRDNVPASAVIRWERGVAEAVAVSGNTVPGSPEATFEEFSSPMISSTGNVLFAARLAGSKPSSGLFFWTPQATRAVALPPELHLRPDDLLVPAYVSRDEAVFVTRGTSMEAVMDQFFRAVAIKNFQDVQPQPELSETVEVLPPRTGPAPVKMLLVAIEGEDVQVGVLDGDPSQPVLAKRPIEGAEPEALGPIQAQTPAPRGNVIFAATPLGGPEDLALYCYCEGQVNRLTSPEEFWQVAVPAHGRPILSLTGDGQRTVAFIAPSDESGESVAIYVASLP